MQPQTSTGPGGGARTGQRPPAPEPPTELAWLVRRMRRLQMESRLLLRPDPLTDLKLELSERAVDEQIERILDAPRGGPARPRTSPGRAAPPPRPAPSTPRRAPGA